jgi:hypothetical protein
MSDERTERLYALKRAAEEIANPRTALGQDARAQLHETTLLSEQGIDYALSECLESDVPRGTLSSLARRASRVSRAHVLLSANVFVGAFRAIALALCQSPRVMVRASRRAPTMAQLLHRGSNGAFDLVESLSPEPGDHVWAYGADETLASFSRTLLPGVHFHGHGSGMGVAVFRDSSDMRKSELSAAADALARDIAAFDQRGCLSPRILFVEGSRSFSESVCDLLVDSLTRIEEQIPRGRLSDAEKADALWHESTIRFVGSAVKAGQGWLYLDPENDRITVPPVGRYLNVTVTDNVAPLITRIQGPITSVGFFNPGPLEGLLRESIGERRYVEVGQMQTPAFDGPVDKRSGWDAEVL